MGRSWTRVFGRPTSVRAGSHDGRMAAQILDYHVFVGMQYIFIMHPQKRVCAQRLMQSTSGTNPKARLLK